MQLLPANRGDFPRLAGILPALDEVHACSCHPVTQRASMVTWLAGPHKA